MAAPTPDGGWSGARLVIANVRSLSQYTIVTPCASNLRSLLTNQTDPQYQIQLVACYLGVVALATVVGAGSVFRFLVLQRRAREGWAIGESWDALGRGRYARLHGDGGEKARSANVPQRPGLVGRAVNAARAVYYSTLLRPVGPHSLGLTAGHFVALALIPALILAALLPQQQVRSLVTICR